MLWYFGYLYWIYNIFHVEEGDMGCFSIIPGAILVVLQKSTKSAVLQGVDFPLDWYWCRMTSQQEVEYFVLNWKNGRGVPTLHVMHM